MSQQIWVVGEPRHVRVWIWMLLKYAQVLFMEHSGKVMQGLSRSCPVSMKKVLDAFISFHLSTVSWCLRRSAEGFLRSLRLSDLHSTDAHWRQIFSWNLAQRNVSMLKWSFAIGLSETKGYWQVEWSGSMSETYCSRLYAKLGAAMVLWRGLRQCKQCSLAKQSISALHLCILAHTSSHHLLQAGCFKL